MTFGIEATKAYQTLKVHESPFIGLVNQIYTYSLDFLPKINRIFANYTGHGISHSLNVMDYMFELIDKPEKLSDLELVVLIYTALLHDIGMVVNDKEIEKIKGNDTTIVDRKYSLVLAKFHNETTALQECIRPIHGVRSFKHINNMDNKYFLVPGYTNISFQNDVAKICAAHNENFDWIQNNLGSDIVKGKYSLNSQFISLLLRIADYLDIDEERAPLYLYKYIDPNDIGDLEWKQHFVIENKDKIVIDENTGNKNIEFYGESSNPSVHRKLLKYFDSLNHELERAVEFSETFHDKKYLLTVKPNVLNKIRTKGFNFSDFKLSLDYKAVTSLLMGENIYGDRKHGLRELIQNAIDACKIMQEESVKNSDFFYDPYSPFISIGLDRDRRQVVIYDNGRGMSLDILKKYFLNVGVSYYKSDDYVFKGNKYAPIGNYGIGFLACFMLSDKVSVVTKYYGDMYASRIEFERSSEYICLTYEDIPRRQGTEIILDYDQFMSAFDNDYSAVKTYIQSNFLNCEIPIRITNINEGKSNYDNLELKKISEFFPNSISLNKYLNAVQINVQFTYKGIDFPKNFSDLLSDESYLYNDENELVEDSESNPVYLKNYSKDGMLRYISVPIISSSEEDEYQKAYDVLDDFDEALSKINYDIAYILAMDDSLYYESNLIDENNDYIVGDYTLKQFRNQIGHSTHVPTCVNLEEQRIIQGEGNKVLPYNVDVGFAGKYYFDHTDSIYIKNVLISKAKLKIPFLIKGIQLQGAILNIQNKDIIPNISRNDISEQQNKEISYAVGKALHLWIYENGNFDQEEKLLIKKFIQTCYPKSNNCLTNT